MLVVGSAQWYRRALPMSLRQGFDITFCDLRLWAESPTGFDPTTITRDTFSDDIEAIRDALGLVRPVILGHSIHGTIAIEYARRYPGVLRGVAAIGAHPIGYDELWPAVAEYFPRDAGPERLAAHRRNLATYRVPTKLETPQDFIDQYVANAAIYWFDPTFDSSSLWDGVAPNLGLFAHLIGTLYLHYEVEPISVPLFIGQGRYDYDVPTYLWEEARRRLPAHEFRLYDKSGHTPPLDQPDEFAADLLTWADRV
jgi:proline iminopeptidase